MLTITKTFKSAKTSLALLACCSILQANSVFAENEHSTVVIEAEDFASQHKDDKRRWLVFSKDTPEHNYPDSDTKHVDGASNGKYIEILPDTRANHYEKLEHDVNFSGTPGTMAILSYPTYFEKAGTYYVWARAYSTGSEDNGVHIGLNGQWPETSERLQLCQGKGKWTWSSAQRVPSNHCGTPKTITLDIPSPGVHNVMISMREDGFELDKLLLTTDSDYQPKGIDQLVPEKVITAFPEKQTLTGIKNYARIFHATSDFSISKKSKIPLFPVKKIQALAIDASKPEYRDSYAYAQTVTSKREVGKFDLTLVALAETKAQSKYRVLLNNKIIGKFTSSIATTNFQEEYFKINNIELKKGDVLTVAAKAQSNDQGYSSGFWRALAINRKGSY